MTGTLPDFIAFASACGLTVTPEQRTALSAGAQLLASAASASGLSQYRDPDTALLRAMGPALTYFAFEALPRTGTVADLGSGSAAIGATIALFAPQLQIDLVDRARRAYTAAELLIARMQLPNARAVQVDISELEECRYDAVVLRALAQGPTALRTAARVVCAGGFIGAYHRSGDAGFHAPEPFATVVGTRPTIVPEMSMTCYRR